MNVIDALLKRRSVSTKLLRDPGPSDEQLDTLIRAGARAADHGRLEPWRFIVVRGDARVELGNVFARARQLRDPQATPENLEQERRKPMRAPTVLIVGVRIVHDNKNVREIDQVLAAAAAAQNVLLAAFAMGFGAMWLTGSNSHDPNVKKALGLDAEDAIVGSLYIGSIAEMPAPIAVDSLDAIKQIWLKPAFSF